MRHPTLPLLTGACVLLTVLACGPSLATPTATIEPPTATPVPPTPTPEPESTLIPIDATWSEYTNYRLGFALRIPNTMFHGMGDCVWREDGDDHSYRPVMAEVPVAVFEDVDRVFITAASVIELTGQTQEPSGLGYRSFFSGCERIVNTLETVRTQEMTSAIWEIGVREVNSEADLEALVDEVYGEACQFEGTSESDTPGVLRVHLQGDGLPPEETACWLNYTYVFLYSPELHRAATWITGQSIYFIYDPSTGEGYDGQMRESFRFLP